MTNRVTALSFDQLDRLKSEWANPSVTDDAIDQIRTMGINELPREACGILLGEGHLFPCHNTSPTPEVAYELKFREIAEVVKKFIGARKVPEGVLDVGMVVWHTHPSGFVGPSREDITMKREFTELVRQEFTFLVVSLPDGPATRF